MVSIYSRKMSSYHTCRLSLIPRCMAVCRLMIRSKRSPVYVENRKCSPFPFDFKYKTYFKIFEKWCKNIIVNNFILFEKLVQPVTMFYLNIVSTKFQKKFQFKKIFSKVTVLAYGRFY